MADLNYYLGPWQRKRPPLADAPDAWAWAPPDEAVGMLDFSSLPDCGTSPSTVDMRGIGLFCVPRAVTLPSEYDLLDSGDAREIQIATAHRDLVEAVLGVRIEAAGTLAEGVAALFASGDPMGQERWKPLAPNSGGMYEIHVGGHSSIWSRKFQGPTDPAWNRLRDMLRFDLKQHDDDCKVEARRLRDEAKELRKQGKDKEADERDRQAAYTEPHAESVLDWMSRKYQCAPTELNTEIRRGRASTTISDSFSGTLGAWTQDRGTWEIASGEVWKTAVHTQFDLLRHNTALSSADHYTQAKVTYGWETYAGPCTRCASSVTGYFAVNYTSATLYLFKLVSGTETSLGSFAKSVVEYDVVKLSSSGSSHTGYANGSAGTPITDTAISGNLYAGLTMYYGSSSTLDNFEASDGLSGGHPSYAYAQQ